MKQFLIGSYAPEGEPSIFGVELDEEKQKLRLLWEDGQVQNPSFLYLHPNCHVLYAVEERVPNGGLAVMIKTEEGWLLKERLLSTPWWIRYVIILSLVPITLEISQILFAIRSLALPSHTSVPCDRPEIWSRSEKFFGFASISI